MRFVAKLTALMTLSLVSVLASVADNPDPLIEKALKSSGIVGQLDDLAEAVLVSIPLDAFPDSKMKRESVSFLKESAAKGSLVPFVREAVREDLDESSLAKVVSFYDSRLGKKVGRMQESALDTAVLKSIREARALSASLKESRSDALQRIVSAERVSQVNAILLQKMVEGLLEGYFSETQLSGNEAEATRGQAKLILERIKVDCTRSEETAQVAFAYTFRSLDDKELEELATFSESEPAVRFRKAVQKGLEPAVLQTARALGTAIARWRLQGEKGTSEQQKGRVPSDTNSLSEQ